MTSEFRDPTEAGPRNPTTTSAGGTPGDGTTWSLRRSVERCRARIRGASLPFLGRSLRPSRPARADLRHPGRAPMGPHHARLPLPSGRDEHAPSGRCGEWTAPRWLYRGGSGSGPHWQQAPPASGQQPGTTAGFRARACGPCRDPGSHPSALERFAPRPPSRGVDISDHGGPAPQRNSHGSHKRPRSADRAQAPDDEAPSGESTQVLSARASDPDKAEEVVTGLFLPHRLDLSTGDGALDMKLSALTLGSVTVARLGYGRDLRLVTTEATQFHVNTPVSGTVHSRRGSSDRLVTSPRKPQCSLPVSAPRSTGRQSAPSCA